MITLMEYIVHAPK